ncbi:unnamed protein product [Blepharisma stoltei]|uniref:Ycf1 n=1 Tax=Blepharisma stoltei TaxID=1481888 RepID=A0AAU9INF4_9CILI|nr:unnamed protein product [Blepharisma stoltei]
MAKKLIKDLYSTHFSLGFNEDPKITTSSSSYLPHCQKTENFRTLSQERIALGHERHPLRSLSQEMFTLKEPVKTSPRRIVPGQRNSDTLRLGSSGNDYKSSSCYAEFHGDKVPELIKINSNLSSIRLGDYKKKMLSTMREEFRELNKGTENKKYLELKNYMREKHFTMSERNEKFIEKNRGNIMIGSCRIVRNNYTPSKIIFGNAKDNSKLFRSSSQVAFRKFDVQYYKNHFCE